MGKFRTDPYDNVVAASISWPLSWPPQSVLG